MIFHPVVSVLIFQPVVSVLIFQPIVSGGRSTFYSSQSSSTFLGDDTHHGGGGGGGPKEPEFVTHNQLIEVVLGDTVILPCKIANIGKFMFFILFYN